MGGGGGGVGHSYKNDFAKTSCHRGTDLFSIDPYG